MNYGTVERLIELVKANPSLYDRSNRNYKVPEYRDQVWHRIATDLNCEDDDAKRAWRTLRDKFVRVLREKSAKKRESYQYYEPLQFLVPYAQPGERMQHAYKCSPEQTFKQEHTSIKSAPSELSEPEEFGDDENNCYQDDEFEAKNDNEAEYLHEDPFNDVVEQTMYEIRPPKVKREKRKRPAVEQPDDDDDDDDDEHHTDRETFEDFLRSVMHELIQSQPPELDAVDKYFLSMASSVKEANVVGMDLLHLKCNMMNHLVKEISKCKNT